MTSHSDIVATLRGSTFSFASEYDLQAAVSAALTSAGVEHRREVDLSEHGRIDLLAGRVGIEVKVAGTSADLREQVDRYLCSPDVDTVVVVTTVSHHTSHHTSPDVSVVYLSELNGRIVHQRVEHQPGDVGSLAMVDGEWTVGGPPHVMIRLKRVFPRMRSTRGGVLKMKPTNEVAADLVWVLSRWPMRMSDDDRALLVASAETHEQSAAAVASILSGGASRTDIELTPARPPLWGHQQTNMDMVSAVQRILITDELGGGKTYSASTTFRNPGALPAVVVVPTHLTHQWVDEINATWPGLTTHVPSKTQPYAVDPVDVFVVPYSKLAGWGTTLAGAHTVIFDEIQELRNGTQTQKGTAAWALSQAATYVVGLSATPVHNYGADIFNVMSYIRPDLLGSWSEFLREWCGSGYDNKPKVSNPEALASFLRSEGAMIGAVLPKRESMWIGHTVESNQRTFEAIAGDVEQMAAALLSPDVVGSERFTLSGQFDMRMRQATGVAKAPYVATFVEMILQSEQKVMLFGWHRQCYQIWQERLSKYGVCMYTGSETAAKKHAARDRFVNGKDRVFMISLKSGAGLDGLQTVCRTAVFGELDWSPATHKQAVGRLDRPGQTRPVLAYFLTSNAGADPTMMNVLGIKDLQAAPFTTSGLAESHLIGGDPRSTSDHIRDMAQRVIGALPDQSRNVVSERPSSFSNGCVDGSD